MLLYEKFKKKIRPILKKSFNYTKNIIAKIKDFVE